MTNEASGRNPRTAGVRLFALLSALLAVPLFFGCSLNAAGGGTTGGTNSSGGVSGSTAAAGGSVAAGSVGIGGSAELGGIPASGVSDELCNWKVGVGWVH
jgi:hypothetical protein